MNSCFYHVSRIARSQQTTQSLINDQTEAKIYKVIVTIYISHLVFMGVCRLWLHKLSRPSRKHFIVISFAVIQLWLYEINYKT